MVEDLEGRFAFEYAGRPGVVGQAVAEEHQQYWAAAQLGQAVQSDADREQGDAEPDQPGGGSSRLGR